MDDITGQAEKIREFRKKAGNDPDRESFATR
jgi:hypothetical protein